MSDFDTDAAETDAGLRQDVQPETEAGQKRICRAEIMQP